MYIYQVCKYDNPTCQITQHHMDQKNAHGNLHISTSTAQQFIALHCTVMLRTVLNCIVWHYVNSDVHITLYCIVLHCTTLNLTTLRITAAPYTEVNGCAIHSMHYNDFPSCFYQPIVTYHIYQAKYFKHKKLLVHYLW